MSKNLIARLAVAAVAIPVILWICYQGGSWLFGMLLLFAIIAQGEFLVGERTGPGSAWFWLTQVTMIATLVGFSGFAPAVSVPEILEALHRLPYVPLLAFFLLSSMILAMGPQTPAELFTRHTRLFWSTVYVGVLYAIVYRIGQGTEILNGGDLLLMLFGLLWVGDSAAMFTGMAIGRHKLAPTVSPNKTVEGFVGGIIGAVVVGIIVHFWRLPGLTMFDTVVIAVGCSVFGQLGDLVESMWKRSLGIKDSSAIIPGHGGVLDRFDSLLFAAPFMLAYLTLIS